MFVTLKNLKDNLDNKTIILPGHDYSIKRESSLEEQIEGNPFMHFDNLNKFIDYRMIEHDKIREYPYKMVSKD